jgi:hypothetical protein
LLPPFLKIQTSGSEAIKNPGPIKLIDPGFPFFPSRSFRQSLGHGEFAIHSGRFSDFWIIRITAPSHRLMNRQWQNAAFVPNYSGGPVPDFNRVPYYVPNPEHLNGLRLFIEIHKKVKKNLNSVAWYTRWKMVFLNNLPFSTSRLFTLILKAF